MKKLALTILLASFTGIMSMFSQIDSSSLKKLNDKFNEIKQMSKRIDGFKKDVSRYERLLKNKDITQSEFNDLIEGLCDLLNLNENTYILRNYQPPVNYLNTPLKLYN